MKTIIIFLGCLLFVFGCLNNDDTIHGDAVLTGHIRYHGMEDYENSNPMYITLYDSENYNKAIASHTLHYPDTSFTITNLPEMQADLIIHGADIVSNKICDISLISENKKDTDVFVFNYHYLLDAPHHHKKIDIEFKNTEIDSLSSSNILNEYNCTLVKFEKYNFYPRAVLEAEKPDNLTLQEITDILNNDKRVYKASMFIYAELD